MNPCYKEVYHPVHWHWHFVLFETYHCTVHWFNLYCSEGICSCLKTLSTVYQHSGKCSSICFGLILVIFRPTLFIVIFSYFLILVIFHPAHSSM